MTSNIVATSFNGTCVTINYPCTVGSRYVDPCDCSFYYLCRDIYSIIRLSCAPGTAYDHKEKNAYCQRLEQVVVNGICDQKEPWDRCEDAHPNVDVDEDKLERWCTGSGYFTPAPPKPGSDDGGNAGAIVGAILAILIIAAIVVFIVVYVRRKGNPIPHIKQTRFWRQVIRREGREDGNSQQSTPRYTGDPETSHDDEETYAEIDEAAVYKDPSGKRKSSVGHTDSHANETYDREDVTYDNPALERDTPPPDTENNPAPPAYSQLDNTGETPRSYSSLNEHQRARELNEMDNDTGSIQPAVGDDGYLMAEPIGQSRSARGLSADPAYYELEKDEHASDTSFVA